MESRRDVAVVRERLGVFTSGEAYCAGWTPSSLSRAVAAGRLLRLRRGVHVPVDLDQELHPADRARRHRARCAIAVALVTDRAVVTGLAAATIEGWPTWAPAERACVDIPGGTATSVVGVHLHRGGMLGHAWSDAGGFRRTRATRTVVEVAREFGTEAGLVVADAAVAAGATDRDALDRAIEHLVGRRGVGNARPLPELVDPRSESVLESRSRWRLVVHQIPRPQPQTWLYDVEGHFLGRADFYWDEGVVGEADGAEKLTDPEARDGHLRRQHGLARAHLRVVRWGVRDLQTFGRTAAWIREELAAARADPRPRAWIASPRRLGSEFAVRSLLAANSKPSRR